MIAILILLLAVGALAFRASTPDDRARLWEALRTRIDRLRAIEAANRRRCGPFRDALRSRTRWAPATPALLALNVIVYGLMLSHGGLADSSALVNWGANLATRTAHGEWWRLLTALFIHRSLFELFVTSVVLVSAGLALERLVGSLALLIVYVAGGVLFSLTILFRLQTVIVSGPAGALWALYGLLFAWLAWGATGRAAVTVPLDALIRIAPGAALFACYSTVAVGLGRPALFAFAAGFGCGLGLLIATGSLRPSRGRLLSTAAATATMAVACAVPLHGLADARPQFQQLLALETRTSSGYDVALDKFHRRRITADALARTIDRAIVPEFDAADATLKPLNKVPPEQTSLLADARAYVRLRRESWQLRAAALRQTTAAVGGTTGLGAEARHRATLQAFGRAGQRERASLEALARIRMAASAMTPDDGAAPEHHR